MFGLFRTPIAFHVRVVDAGRTVIGLPGIHPDNLTKVMAALKAAGRLRIKSRVNDFGRLTTYFSAAFESYSLHCSGTGAVIRGESGGDEVDRLAHYMRASRRFVEIDLRQSR